MGATQTAPRASRGVPLIFERPQVAAQHALSPHAEDEECQLCSYQPDATAAASHREAFLTNITYT